MRYHGVHVQQFIEEHELHSDEDVVLGPYVTHVVVELTGDPTQLRELVGIWPDSTGVCRVAPVPGEFVKPGGRGERKGGIDP